MRRSLSLLLAAVTGAACLTLARPAAAADAGTPLLVCPGIITNTYTPGLTLALRPTSYVAQATYGPCAGDTAVVFATSSGSGVVTLSCVIGESAPYERVYHWSNGESSVVRYRLNLNLKPAGESVIAGVGDVVSGRYAGAHAVETVTDLQLNPLNCLSPTGVTQTAGPVTLTLTP